MSEHPKLSILMTIYNGMATIDRAIKSVNALDGYGNFDWELIICDDGSDDGIGRFISSFNDTRIIYRKFDRAGHIAKARNRTLEYAKGKYVVILDSDDMLIPEGILAQVEFLDKFSIYGWCHAPAFILDEDGKWKMMYLLSMPAKCAEAVGGWTHNKEKRIEQKLPIPVPDNLFEDNLEYSFINNWGCIIRTDLIKKIGGWSEDIPGNGCGEDYDLNLKLCKISLSKWIPVVSYAFTQNTEKSHKRWDIINGQDMGPFANYEWIRAKFREGVIR